MCLEIIYSVFINITQKGYNEEVLTITAIDFLEIVKVVSPSSL